MKIETLNNNWKPIVITIETREEAQELYELICDSNSTIDLLEGLFRKLEGLL